MSPLIKGIALKIRASLILKMGMSELHKIFGNRLLFNEPMSKHSTLRLGGAARYFFEAKNLDEIIKAMEAAKKDSIAYSVIGGGSNILVSDYGFDGLVIKMADSEIKIDGEKIYAGAGVFSVSLARAAVDAGLTGLEWMATLPGTIGGAVYGNAGAYGEETKNRLARVQVLEEGTVKWIQKEDCHFGYRDSRFKKTKEIILAAEFELKKGDKMEINKKMKILLDKRKGEQPLGSSSAGCIFKNFQFSIFNFQFQMPEEFLKNKTIPAGWLIEKAGMKGFCVGKTRVSDIHGNFSLNLGGSSADELARLISAVKKKVRDKFGIELQEEVQYIGL